MSIYLYIFRYTKTPLENDPHRDEHIENTEWPKNGRIDAENVVMRYRPELEPVHYFYYRLLKIYLLVLNLKKK